MNSEKLSIAWLNLRLEADSFAGSCFRRQTRPILRRLDGHFHCHSLNALMGPSGAGKTSLLNCLSGYLTSGSFLTPESQIFVPNNQKQTSIVSYFIDQNATENVVISLTIREILEYAFCFKNSNGFCREKAETHILNVLNDLLLNPSILDRKFALCSGGEQKRVAIAQELMDARRLPDFLFLDEPTTGLDSLAAYEVIRSLKRLSQLYPMTIVASIHAPNPATLELIDRLYILAKGGVCIYSGPPGDLPRLSINESTHEKPIETLIKLAGKGLDEPQVRTLVKQCLEENYKKLSSNSEMLQSGSSLKSQSKSFRLSDFCTLVCRTLRVQYISEFRQSAGTLLLCIVFLLGISSFYESSIVKASGCISRQNDTGIDRIACDQETYWNVNTNRNYLLMVHIFQTFIAVSVCTYIAFNQIKTIKYEHRNRWYSMGVSYFASILTQLLYITLLTLIFSTTSYLAIGQQGADGGALNFNRIGHYIASTWLTMAYMGEIGSFFGYLVTLNIEVALLTSNFVYDLTLLLSDFGFQTDQLPHPLLVGVSDVTAAKYCMRYFNYAIFGVDRCPDDEDSWLLKVFSVNSKPIEFYIWRILENILVLRLITLLVLHVRLHGFNLLKIFSKNSRENISEFECKFYPLDFDDDCTNAGFDSSLDSLPEIDYSTQSKFLVAWRNLTLFESSPFYYRTSGDDLAVRKRLLCNLNGEARTGSLNAVMGASGSGKTSLLKALNGQMISRLSTDTRFYLSSEFPISTCFITQDVTDHLFPALTVKQNLLYASRFKNPHLSEQISHKQIVENLLKEFEMADAGETRVGHCSGGERKRLALALELTAQRMPNLVCFDEPTSGLDSGAAEAVMACFKALVRRHNIALIASIHQPTTRILELLDQLYVLAPGGVCVYSGPPKDLDSVERLLEQSYSGTEVQVLVNLQKTSIEPEETLLQDTQLIDSGIPGNQTRFSLQSVWILSCRYAVYFRGYWWMEVALAYVLYLVYGLTMIIFYDTKKLSEYSGCIVLEKWEMNQACVAAQPAQENLTFIYFSNNMFLMCVALSSTIKILRELNLFYNEHRNGWYSSGAFFLQKSLFDFLPFVPIFALYVYIIDIYKRDIYWSLLLLYLIQIAAMQALGYIFVLISRQRLIPIIISALSVILLFTQLSGNMNPIPHLHYFYQFLAGFSVFRHALESQVLLQFGFGRCESGIQFVLAWLEIEDADYWRALWMLVANFVFYRALAAYLLIVQANPRKNRQISIRKNT